MRSGAKRAARWIAVGSLLVVTLAVVAVRISPAAYAGSGTNYVVYIGATLANGTDSGEQPAIIAVSDSNLNATAGTVAVNTANIDAVHAVAITPSAGAVFGLGFGDGDSIETATIPSGSYIPAHGAVSNTISSANSDEADVAATPDGKFAYAAGDGGLRQINTASDAVKLFSYPDQDVTISSVAVSPNAKTVYVAGAVAPPDGSQVAVIFAFDAATGVVTDSYVDTSGAGTSITALTVSPDGTNIWAGESSGDTSRILRLAPPSAANEALPTTGGIAFPRVSPTALAISPDGQTVYAATLGIANVAIVGLYELNATAKTPVAIPITLPTSPNRLGDIGIQYLAVTPDDRTLLATSGLNDSSAGTLLSASIPVPTNTTTSPVVEHFPAAAGSSYYGLAVTPDQAPVARVAVSSAEITAGGAITFSTGPSTVAFGNITGYKWTVSGGTCTSLSTPSITCQFATPGSFSAQVVETDGAGNSTVASVLPAGGVVFTGNTASLVPSNLARSAPVTVAVTAIPTTTSSTTTTLGPTTTQSTTTTTVAPTTTTTVPKVTLHPQLTVNPGIGPPGFVTQANGTGFPPNTPLTVTWSVGVGSAKVTSSAAGTFSVQMLIMDEDQPGTRNAQVATFPTAKAPFLVVPGSLQPGGDDFSLLYDR